MPAANDRCHDLTMAISSVMPEATLHDVECQSKAAAAARMDEEAFRAFYERTARQVWAYLCRITDERLAEDLLQEAYYRVYRAGDVYESESHRRNALFRIATNLARDGARKRRGRTDIPLPEDESASALAADDGAAQRVVDRTDLRRALARLQPLQREILWLAYAQGSSHEEIAGITGVSPKSIKSLLYRARRKLAGMLRGEGGCRG
jgi:RNA polymerase sigma-70 factor (ECF subfamily)